MGMKFSDAMLEALKENTQNPILVRRLASYALGMRIRARGEQTPDVALLERQVRDLTANNKKLRVEIAALRSQGPGA